MTDAFEKQLLDSARGNVPQEQPSSEQGIPVSVNAQSILQSVKDNMSQQESNDVVGTDDAFSRFEILKQGRQKIKKQHDTEVSQFTTQRDQKSRRVAAFSFLKSFSQMVDSATTEPLAAALNFPFNLAPESNNPAMPQIPSGGIELMFKEILEVAGTPIPEDLPDTASAALGRDAGTTMATLIGARFGANIKLAEQPVKSTLGKIKEGGKKILKGLGESIRDKPKTTVGLELAGASAAGVAGFHTSKEFPDSPVARFVSEVTAGTLATGFIPRKIKEGATAVASTIRKKSSANAHSADVQKRLQRDLDDNVEDIIKKLEAGEKLPQLKGVTVPSQVTGSALLATIHEALIRQSDKLTGQHNTQLEQFNEALLEAGRTLTGDPVFTRRALIDGQNSLKQALELMVENAQTLTEQKIKTFTNKGIKLTSQEANEIAQKELIDIKKVARVQESELYNLIPNSVEFSMAGPVRELNKILRGRTIASDVKEIPPYVGELIGKVTKLNKKQRAKILKDTGEEVTHVFKAGALKKTANAGELTDLRGRLLEDATIASSEGKANRARILGGLAESIRVSLADAPDDITQEASHAIKMAHAFSKKFNDVFTRGHIAPMLRKVPQGGFKLQPDDFLDKGVVGSGTKKSNLLRALVEDPAQFADVGKLKAAVEDWVKGEFARKFIADGQLTDPNAAVRFMKANQETFELFPKIKDDLQTVISSGKVETALIRRIAGIGKKLENPNVSFATLFIQKQPKEAFNAIRNTTDIGSNNVDKQIQLLLNQVSKDDSGKALEGLQSSYFQWVMERGSSSSPTISGNVNFLSGNKLTQTINDPATKVMSQRVLNKQQLELLEHIREGATRLDISRAAKPSKGGVVSALDSPASILITLSRVAGAQLGRQISKVTGGGTVQTPGIISSRMAQLLEAGVKDPITVILNEAFITKDPTIMKALLKEIKTPEELKKVSLKIGVWLGTITARLGVSYIPSEESTVK